MSTKIFSKAKGRDIQPAEVNAIANEIARLEAKDCELKKYEASLKTREAAVALREAALPDVPMVPHPPAEKKVKEPPPEELMEYQPEIPGRPKKDFKAAGLAVTAALQLRKQSATRKTQSGRAPGPQPNPHHSAASRSPPLQHQSENVEELLKRIQELEQLLKERDTEIADLKGQLQKLMSWKQVTEDKAKSKEVEEAEAKAQEKVDALERKRAEAEEARKRVEGLVEELQASQTTLLEKQRLLTEELWGLREKESEWQAVLQESEQLHDQKDTLVKELRGKLVLLEAKLPQEGIESKLRMKLEQQGEEHKKTLEKLQAMIDEKEQEAEALQRSLMSKDAEIIERDGKHTVIEAALNETQTNHKKSTKRLATLEAELAAERERVKTLQAQVNTLKSESVRWHREREELDTLDSALTQERVKALERQLEEERQAKLKALQDAEAAREAVKLADDYVAEVEGQMAIRHAEWLQAHEEETRALRNHVNEFAHDLKSLSPDLKEEMAEVRSAAKDAISEVQECKQHIRQMVSMGMGARSKSRGGGTPGSSTQRVGGREEEIMRLRAGLSEAMSTIKTTQAHLLTNEKRVKLLDSEAKGARRESATVRENLNWAEKRQHQLEERNNELRELAHSMGMDLETTRAEITKQTSQIRKMRVELQQWKDECADLRKKLKVLMSKDRGLDVELEQAEEASSEARGEVVVLKEMVRTLQASDPGFFPPFPGHLQNDVRRREQREKELKRQIREFSRRKFGNDDNNRILSRSSSRASEEEHPNNPLSRGRTPRTGRLTTPRSQTSRTTTPRI